MQTLSPNGRFPFGFPCKGSLKTKTSHPSDSHGHRLAFLHWRRAWLHAAHIQPRPWLIQRFGNHGTTIRETTNKTTKSPRNGKRRGLKIEATRLSLLGPKPEIGRFGAEGKIEQPDCPLELQEAVNTTRGLPEVKNKSDILRAAGIAERGGGGGLVSTRPPHTQAASRKPHAASRKGRPTS